MGDDGENDRVLALLHRAADQVTRAGYAEVEVATLREDWEEKRISAEAHIRGYVEDQIGTNSVLVIPMRLSGFGPYADVLAGLEYHAGEALLPHTDIGRWVLGPNARYLYGEEALHPHDTQGQLTHPHMDRSQRGA